MKVNIVADGTKRGTIVRDVAGNPIEGITEIIFKHQGGGSPEIELGLVLIPAVIDGEAVVYGPNGKLISKIIYKDGSESVY
ncbi:hypothetical protein GR212_15410 [Rhizobium lusitanum]|uniref:Uncharacterized protein n=1 Tax=Rhizobium lusitanum TaxID=293958 RepID=A0A6L9U660_9HYPH|nr:hypothetical protein [Rhizobium lusitanum]NEI70971.1 hypothetical protein [Rhizobium lusitanum]